MAVALAALFLPPIVANTSALGAQTLMDALRRLQSPMQDVRARGLSDILALASNGLPANASLMKRAAGVQTLARQNDRVAVLLIDALMQADERAKRATDEGFGDYWGDLVGTVAALHDQRAIPALLGAVETGGLAEKGLVAFGDDAVPALIAVPQTASVLARAGVVRTLGQIAMQPGIRSRDAIKKALKTKLSDSEWLVRNDAIEALASYNDADLRPVMWEISKHDRYRGPRAIPYPVRAAATAWLRVHPDH